MQFRAATDDGLEIEAWIAQMIAQNGYAQISLQPPGPGQPGFAFTVGLEASRQIPEFFCMGVAPDIAARLFAVCIDGLDAGLFDLSRHDVDVGGLVEGHVLRIRRVAPALVWMANEIRPHRARDIATMVQLLMPDNDGHFPGEAACDPEIGAAQDPDRLLLHAVN